MKLGLNRRLGIRGFVSLVVQIVLLSFLTVSGFGRGQDSGSVERERWLFLGDSITQGGHYVDYVETWFLLNEANAPEMINLGLSSETVSGLSESDHPFPRPFLHTRLVEVLDRVRPDVVFACYGMNCGIYHPFSEERFAAYQKGIRELVTECQKIGARVVLLAPPPYAGRVKPKQGPVGDEPYGYKLPYSGYNDV